MSPRSLCVAFAVLSLPACYDSFGSDALITFDASPSGRDGGSPEPADLGGPRPRDAGPIDAGNVCEVGEVLGPFVGPRCGPETVACLEACERDPDPGFCQERCIDEDPACATCFNETVIRCINENGCQEAWDTFACCSEELCPGFTGGERLVCADACIEEIDAYGECANDRAIDGCEGAFSECL